MNPLTQKVLGVSCSGLECTHELGEKHWVVTEDDIEKIHTLIRKETVKECVEIVKNSRTIEEAHGIGIREDTARTQAVVDINVALTKIST